MESTALAPAATENGREVSRGLARSFDDELAIVRSIEQKLRDHYTDSIQGKARLNATGYLCLARCFGLRVIETQVVPVESDRVGPHWLASFDVLDRDGVVIASASSICSKAEQRWRRADENAVRSMASTRARTKALRMVLGPVVAALDLEATEADGDDHGGVQQAPDDGVPVRTIEPPDVSAFEMVLEKWEGAPAEGRALAMLNQAAAKEGKPLDATFVADATSRLLQRIAERDAEAEVDPS